VVAQDLDGPRGVAVLGRAQQGGVLLLAVCRLASSPWYTARYGSAASHSWRRIRIMRGMPEAGQQREV